MTPSEFVERFPGFGGLPPTEQVKRFCWYLVNDSGKSPFTGTDVARCFSEANVHKPSSVSAFLKSLVTQRVLIQRANGYVIASGMNDKLGVEPQVREATVTLHKLLSELPSQVSLPLERVYLEEALICFRHSAFRAAVVMTWNLAYDHLCNWIITNHLAAFNAQLPKSYPKAAISAIMNRDQFAFLKESEVIQVAKSATFLNNGLFKLLNEKLDKRNSAAHPSGVTITQLTAESIISDLIENVVLKL